MTVARHLPTIPHLGEWASNKPVHDSTLALTDRDIERFWPKVEMDGPGGCWPWRAAVDDCGYGKFQHGNRQRVYRTQRSHRVAYQLLVGPIPPGLHLDHLCRWPRCCNPEHLEPVTNGENRRRGFAYAPQRLFCPQWHLMTGSNLYLDRKGVRICVTCKRARNRLWMRQRTRSAA